MKITIHRGSKEVGGTCIEVQADTSRIVLDVGLPLFDEHREPLDSFALRRMTKAELFERNILPNVPGLFDGVSRPDAILLSHAHLDHTGLLEHTDCQIPVYASSGTSKMMLAGKLFARQVELPRDRFHEVNPGTPITIGPFQVTGYPVDHSIYGCLAYLIEANGKSLLYSGDLRLHGRKPGMAQSLIATLSNRQIDAMLMEGTHFGLADGHGVTEYELEDEIVGHIQNAPGLVLASFSPQHVDRLVAFIRAAIKTDRTFVADAYTAFVLHLLHREPGLPTPEAGGRVRAYFPENLLASAKGKSLANLIDRFRPAQIDLNEIRNSPSQFVMLFRPSMQAEFSGTYPHQTICLYSRWSGYLENSDWQQTRKLLGYNDGSIIEVHTSGHIHANDIVPFVNQIKPKAVIPVHTFEPKQFRNHFPNAVVAEDGVPFEIH